MGVSKRKYTKKKPNRKGKAKKGNRVARTVTKVLNDRTRTQTVLQKQGTMTVKADAGEKVTGTLPILSVGTDIWDCFNSAMGGTIDKAHLSEAVYINKAEMNVNLTNNDQGKTRLTVYFCRPRRDIPNVGKFAMTTPSTQHTNVDSVITDGWQSTGLSRTETGATKAYFNSLTLTPYQSSSFTRWFQIYKVKAFTLNPGENMNIKLSTGRTKRLMGSYLLPDESLLSYTNLPIVQIKGLSKFLIFQVSGTTVIGAGTESAQVTTGDARIDAVWTQKYTFSKLPPRTNKVLEVSGTLGTITAEAQYGEGEEAPTTEA